MVLRNVVKIAMATVEALGKAFKRSLDQEIIASKRTAARTTTSSESSSSQSQAQEETKANRRHGITLQESMQILNIKALDREEAEKRFEHLFNVNDKSNGGSRYLQQKIEAAKKRVDDELNNPQEKKTD
ncbi:Mitochondrial import inner membrane translocase subunit Tim16 [Aphelenchoides besseyi]|nr:Mitochondrial import inner membrane translocase subunit Tim16 [Aphelenchoides besseyi]